MDIESIITESNENAPNLDLPGKYFIVPRGMDEPARIAVQEKVDGIVPLLGIEEIPQLIEDGVITGGMIPKIETCVDAIKNGVKSAHIIDGRIKHSLLLEIFTKDGIGTMIFE